MTVLYEFAQKQHHHDCCGHVVEHCRQEECQYAEHPQKRALPAGGDVVGQDGESSVYVDKFDDRHGADQEEEGLRDVAQTLHYLDVENVIQSLAV